MNTTPLVSRDLAQQIMPGRYFGITNIVGRLKFLTKTTFVDDNAMFSRGVPYPQQVLESCSSEYGLLSVPRFSLQQIRCGQHNDFSFVPSNRMRPTVTAVGDAHWVLLSSCSTPLLPFLEYGDLEQMVNAARASSLPTFHDLIVALLMGALDVQNMEERAKKRRDDQENVSILFCLDKYGAEARPHMITIDWLMRIIHIDLLRQDSDSLWYDEEGVLARATDFAYVQLP